MQRIFIVGHAKFACKHFWPEGENAVGLIRRKLNKKFKEQHKLLSRLLKIARKNASMTQGEAGDQMGRDQTYIAKLESGAQRPLFVEVEQLAKTYGKALSFFVTIDEVERLDHDLVIPEKFTQKYLARRPGWKNPRLEKRKARPVANGGKRSESHPQY